MTDWDVVVEIHEALAVSQELLFDALKAIKIEKDGMKICRFWPNYMWMHLRYYVV